MSNQLFADDRLLYLADPEDFKVIRHILGVGKSTIYKKLPYIPHYKNGKMIFFLLGEIMNFVLRNRIVPKDEIEARAATANLSR